MKCPVCNKEVKNIDELIACAESHKREEQQRIEQEKLEKIKQLDKEISTAIFSINKIIDEYNKISKKQYKNVIIEENPVEDKKEKNQKKFDREMEDFIKSILYY